MAWEKFEVRGEIVEGKRILLYAAKHLSSTDTLTYIHVGYCWKLPELIAEITTMNRVEVVAKQTVVFYKKGYKPLNLLVESVEPPIWRICETAGGRVKQIEFDTVANTESQLKVFVLKKEGILRTGRSIVHIKAWQTTWPQADLSFPFEMEFRLGGRSTNQPLALQHVQDSFVPDVKAFSWETFVVQDEVVKGKRVLLYAARHLSSTDTLAFIHVGYCWELPDLIEKITTMNPVEVVAKQTVVFHKKGYMPLNLLIESVEPPIWRICEKDGGRFKKIEFDTVANTERHHQVFVLDKEGILRTGRSIVHIKAWQANWPQADLSFPIESSIFTFSDLKKELSSRLTEHDCMELGKYFQIPLDQLKRSSNNKSTSENFLLTLEERGLIHHSNLSRLTEALTKLKIKQCSLVTVTYMKLRASQETDYDRFLAGLSAHLTLSISKTLCKYFKFSNEKTKDVTTSQDPGLSLLLTLDGMGLINATYVSKLEAPLADNHLLQAVAKIHEYQSLIAEDSTVQTDLSDEGKRKLFIKCLQQKTKSWFESMTPVPWKKSCQWKSSDLFVASGLVLTSSVSQTSFKDVDAKSKLHYQDIFTDERLKGKTRIILEGQPGSGKTMLSSQLAYDWSCGRIQDVPIVIYLPLQLVEDKTIVQAIRMFYIQKHVAILEDDIESILANKMDVKIWLILDGLEEYNGRPKKELSEVMKVMMEEKLPKCNVILTARSDYVKDLPQTPMLKIGNFGEDERNEYIEKVYADDIERQEAVKEVMDKIPFIAELCTVPLLFVLSVHNIDSLAELQEQQQNGVTHFVKTIVDVLCPLAEKHYSGGDSQSDSDDEKDDSDDDQRSRPLYTLEELAFNGLCRGTQRLWQKDFVAQNVVNSKEFIDSGILVVEEGPPSYFGVESPPSEKSESTEPGSTGEPGVIAKQQEGINLTSDEIQKADQSPSVTDDRFAVTESESKTSEKRTSHQTGGSSAMFVPLQVKFLHKLIQEYFASKHLARLFWRSSKNHGQYGLFREHLATIKPADLHYVLRFTCHICPPSFHFITSYLMREFKTNDGQIPDYIINCICLCFSEYVGYPGNKVKDIITEMCQTEVISITSKDSPLLLRAKVSLVTFASKSKIPLKGLNLTDVVESVADRTLLLKYDVWLDVLDTLESLEVDRWDQELKNEDYEDLIKFIANSKCIKIAWLLFPSPPEVVKDDKALQDLRARNASIEWIIGARSKHQLSLESGKWPMKSGRGGRSTKSPLALEHVQDEDERQKESEEENKDGVKVPGERDVTDVKDDLRTGDESGEQKESEKDSKDVVRLSDDMKLTDVEFEGREPTHQSEFSVSSYNTDNLATESVVNIDGDVLRISDTGVELEIPPGALEEKTVIKMRIIPDYFVDEETPSFGSNSSVIVELLPSKLKLLKPIKLILPHCLQLKKGMRWTAKVYSSHHEEGTQPQWEEEKDSSSELRETNCLLWLQNFSWKRYRVDDEIIVAKKVWLYAAEVKSPNPMAVLLDVGYCSKYRWSLWRAFKKRKRKKLHSQPSSLSKKGKNPLNISFTKACPDTLHCDESERKQQISFQTLLTTNNSFCTFVLKKKDSKTDGFCTCYVTVGQGEDFVNLPISLQIQPTPSQSGDSQLAAACGGSSLVATTSAAKEQSSKSMTKQNPSDMVTTKTLQDLSKKLEGEWKTVGRNLGLNDPDLYSINVRHEREGSQEVIYQTLKTWKQKAGNSATIRVLAEALKKSGRKDLHDELI